MKNYPECSGNPSSCPENEGYGCCQPNPKCAHPPNNKNYLTGDKVFLCLIFALSITILWFFSSPNPYAGDWYSGALCCEGMKR